jgi:hypothetical protein
MNAGTYGHKILDIYYKLRSQGIGLNEAASQAFSYDPDKDTCECGCASENHTYICDGINECQRCKKCLDFKPAPFQLDQPTRITVTNRLRDYFFAYQSNDFVPLSKNHIEVGFSEPLFEDSKNLFILEGRIDLLATLQGLNVTVDHKFQFRTHNLYPKSIQFKNYALVSKNQMFVINYIRLAKVLKAGETLQREIVCFSDNELRAWKEELIRIFFRIKESYIRATYEQNWSSCMGRYGAPCNYTTLCEENDKNMKKRKQDMLYKISDIQWRPW